MNLSNRLSAEFFGTLFLVFSSCGSGLFAPQFIEGGLGYYGTALITVLTVFLLVTAFINISGAHFNPAVTVAMWVGGRMHKKEVLPYILVQVLGAIVGGFCIYVVAQSIPNFHAEQSGFACNGYGVNSPKNFSLLAGFVTEVLLTGLFLFVIFGSTNTKANKKIAPFIIGITITLVILVGLPVTGTSVNPARSTGTAVFQGTWALKQLWLFWLAPILGAAIAGFFSKKYEAKLTEQVNY